jgi:hypothetical protein
LFFLGGFKLLAGHAVIPFQKLLQRAAVIDVIEESLHRHTRPFEHKRVTDHFWMLRKNIG